MSKEVTPATLSAPVEGGGRLAIEVKDLSKSFGSFRAVDHLSLDVRQGEIFGLLGPNGSGKTTTINMISGLSVPTSGEVRVMGYDVRHQARQVRQILGSVPQETALYEELSAWTNMDFHADLFGIPRKEKKPRITRLLELVQLLDRKDSRVGTFSGGMKRRLALARAMLHDPQLLYLDEPTLGVDVQARRVIWDYILALRDQGKTVLITTNYLEEAQALCERLAIIDHGKLIAVDTPDHLKQTYGGSVIEVETAQPVTDLAALRALEGV
ncbi:MAG TPA: ATP-binding cassette domain-containing protein, partial [Ktedonobacteraceae bacterium]